MLDAQIVILAKEPLPGRAKTRLSPTLTPGQAAQVAAAALEDTLNAVRAVDVAGRTLALEGSATLLPTAGFTVIPQVAGDLGARIAGAFRHAHERQPLPMLLIGMDTPQVTTDLLTGAVELLLADGTDAVLGLAEDGGWWALGLRQPDDSLFHGVPMSTSATGRRQADRLSGAGLRARALPVLRDIDHVDDLLAVAALRPDGRLATVVDRLLAAAS